MINVIAHRSFHFKQEEIIKDQNTGENIAILKNQININARPEVQGLPEWVKETEHFQLAQEDGTIQEVSFVAADKRRGRINNEPKAKFVGIPQAQLADPNQAAEVAETGKTTGVFDPGAIPLGGAVPAGKDWPKSADQNNAGLAG